MISVKRILALSLALMLALCAVSCGGEASSAEPSAKEMLDAAMALFEPEALCDPAIFWKDAEAGSDNELDLGYAGYLFLGEYDAELPEMQFADDWALMMPSGVWAFEIDVMRAKTAAQANELKGLLEKRLANKLTTRGELANYDAAQVPILDGAEVYKSGRYVFLIATTDNAAVKAALSEKMASLGLLEPGETTMEALKKNDPDAVETAALVNIESHVNTTLSGAPVTASVKSDDPSPVPEMTVNIFSANNRVVLGGKCVEGAKIHVRGGVKDKVFGTDWTSWMVEVEIPEGISTLLVTQEAPGKGESEPISITVRTRTDVDKSSHGVCQVLFGDNFQGHFFGQIADWTGTNLLSDKQITSLTSRLKERVDYLKDIDCELIYVIVPNPMRIYPETVPDWQMLTPSTKDTDRTEQFENAAREAGATVIDLTEILTEHRDDEFKIFNKTDSHWTWYGAYWGYYALAEHIAEKYPACAPMEIEGNLRFYNKVVDAGDMMTHLDLKNSLIQENATFVEFLCDTVSQPNLYEKNRNELIFDPIKPKQTIVNGLPGADELPKALILRDSFGTNMHTYFTNMFRETNYAALWSYKFDKNHIRSADPDYYIVLVTERNIGNLLN